jgi:hypothetical protein
MLDAMAAVVHRVRSPGIRLRIALNGEHLHRRQAAAQRRSA